MRVVDEVYPGSINIKLTTINGSVLVISDRQVAQKHQYPITSKQLLCNLTFNTRHQSFPYMTECKQSYNKPSLNAENISLEINVFDELALHKLGGYDN